MQDTKVLRKIVSVIKDKGNQMDDDWLEEAYAREVAGNAQPADWPAIFKRSLETIAKTDAIIAETTHPSFAIGYQVAVAVQQKKPVLLLRRQASDQNAYITGVEDGWTQYESYADEADVQRIIEKFLDDNDIKSKDMRFNFFIDRKIYNYLRWSALRTGKTKAEILRELVEKEIDRENTPGMTGV